MSSGMPTTPTPSPTAGAGAAGPVCDLVQEHQAAHDHQARGLARPAPAASTSALPAPSLMPCEADDEDAWQDDDEYYAARARGFIRPSPLLPSFPAGFSTLPATPAASAARAVRRESAVITSTPHITPRNHRCSARSASRAPPPLIITCASYSYAHARPSSSHELLKPSKPSLYTSPNGNASPRQPAPHTPLPTDGLSMPCSRNWTAYAPLVFTPSPFSTQSHLESLSLLSPPKRFPAEAQGVPCAVSAGNPNDKGWECALGGGYGYDEVPLWLLVACVPSPSSASPVQMFPPSPVERTGTRAVHSLAPAPPPPCVASRAPPHWYAIGLGNHDRDCLRVALHGVLHACVAFAYVCDLHLQAREDAAFHPHAHPAKPLVLLHALLCALRPHTPPALARLAEDLRVRKAVLQGAVLIFFCIRFHDAEDAQVRKGETETAPDGQRE
ncbi:hypothetical protein K438DRAFT_4134 [Mycena galopus ATCC 62051]|nr:hypothetical protein K438DRAFT_4134 [Mycena galopus ATCC 62051]